MTPTAQITFAAIIALNCIACAAHPRQGQIHTGTRYESGLALPDHDYGRWLTAGMATAERRWVADHGPLPAGVWSTLGLVQVHHVGSLSSVSAYDPLTHSGNALGTYHPPGHRGPKAEIHLTPEGSLVHELTHHLVWVVLGHTDGQHNHGGGAY